MVSKYAKKNQVPVRQSGFNDTQGGSARHNKEKLDFYEKNKTDSHHRIVV